MIDKEEVIKSFPNLPIIKKNIDKYYPIIAESLIRNGLTSNLLQVVAFATIRAESESFQPISETVSKYNTSKYAFDLYDFRQDLGHNAKGSGSTYKGRGFIQLTGKYNYKLYGMRLKLDLVNCPELANYPEIASDLLCQFIKDKQSIIESAYVNKELGEGDRLKLIRRAVNGGLHGFKRFEDTFNKLKHLID